MAAVVYLKLSLLAMAVVSAFGLSGYIDPVSGLKLIQFSVADSDNEYCGSSYTTTYSIADIKNNPTVFSLDSTFDDTSNSFQPGGAQGDVLMSLNTFPMPGLCEAITGNFEFRGTFSGAGTENAVSVEFTDGTNTFKITRTDSHRTITVNAVDEIDEDTSVPQDTSSQDLRLYFSSIDTPGQLDVYDLDDPDQPRTVSITSVDTRGDWSVSLIREDPAAEYTITEVVVVLETDFPLTAAEVDGDGTYVKCWDEAMCDNADSTCTCRIFPLHEPCAVCTADGP